MRHSSHILGAVVSLLLAPPWLLASGSSQSPAEPPLGVISLPEAAVPRPPVGPSFECSVLFPSQAARYRPGSCHDALASEPPTEVLELEPVRPPSGAAHRETDSRNRLYY